LLNSRERYPLRQDGVVKTETYLIPLSWTVKELVDGFSGPGKSLKDFVYKTETSRIPLLPAVTVDVNHSQGKTAAHAK